MRRVFAALGVVFGLFVSLLGLLWFLQGADIVRIEPVYCVAECEAITGGSVSWMVWGALAIVFGVLAIVVSLRSWRKKQASPAPFEPK